MQYLAAANEEWGSGESAECGQKIAKTALYCVLCGTPVAQQPSRAAKPSAGGSGAIATGQAPLPASGEALPEVRDETVAEWAEWARTQRFSVTRLRPGYQPEQVDDFVGAICDTFLGVREPPLTASEVRNKMFMTTRLRPGYDEEEVDAFLNEAEWKLSAWQRGAIDDPD